jgi:hypothetical protein
MNYLVRTPGAHPLTRHWAHHPAWLALLLLLFLWQAWLTLGLFGPEHSFDALLDDRPLLSGRHPLHLYHGFLGARHFREKGCLSCYDPSFHAGYPKTPVFDSGSRPAELVLALTGAAYRPAVYKTGLAVFCALVPFLLFLAARGVGLARGPACLACAMGLLVWWGRPCQELLAAGDVDLLLASLLVLVHAGFLIRYHRVAGPTSLVGVVVTGLVGWFAHPLLFALLLPLFLIYYLSAGTRHRLPWHIPLIGGLFLALIANSFWLLDWVGYWWIRVPLRSEAPMLAHRTFRSIWEAPLWGGRVDKWLACLLGAGALVGLFFYNASYQRTTARVLGLAWAGFSILAALGIAWEPLGRLGAAHLVAPALLFATLPAAYAVARLVELAGRRRAVGLAGSLVIVCLFLTPGIAAHKSLANWGAGLWRPQPLEIGLGPDRIELLESVQQHTNEEARVLWEENRGSHGRSRWTALLPVLLPGRSFIGGLDPDAGIEHTAEGLVDQCLAGRPLETCPDADLADYCRRYNVGWVVAWSPAVQARFRRWREAEPVAYLTGEDGQTGRLFRLYRSHSFALKGSANWKSADARRIVLSDLVPDYSAGAGDGQIILSLHYQAGMRVTPSRVRLERAPGADDSIPFVRLRVSEPVGRVMITWDGR